MILAAMRDFLPTDRPALVLAPMQDVTDLPFMRVIARRGAPDWFVTEYFRVHPESCLNRYILRSIVENETGRPVFAQMIGRDLPSLVRTARELAKHPVAGIDLNLGCPAPIVCRKDAGGGLLRNPEAVNRLIGSLRDAIPGKFTVKTRLGYTTADEFPGLLEIFRSHAIDGLTIHGRTVVERYQTPVHPDFVQMAVQHDALPGDRQRQCRGRGDRACLSRPNRRGGLDGRPRRDPQSVDFLTTGGRVHLGESSAPTYRDLWEYVLELYDEIARETPKFNPLAHVQRMKKTLAYISHGLEGEFEYDMRRAKTPEEFQEICRRHLDHDIPLPAKPPVGSKLFCGFEELRLREF